MTNSNSETAAAQLPPEALGELLAEIAIFPTLSQQRGRTYAAGGRVTAVAVEHPLITAQVRGTRAYRVVWERTRDGWIPDCDCPVGVDCKHSYAVACWILAQARALTGYSHPRLARLVPPGLDATIPLPAPRVVRAEKSRPLASSGANRGRAGGFGPFRQPSDYWHRQETLARMLRKNPEIRLDYFASPFPNILREPDTELMCWYLATEIPGHTGGWLPPELEPFRDRPDLASRNADRLQTELADELVSWAASRRPRADRSLRLILDLQRLSDGDVVVGYDARLSGARLRDESRSLNQLLQLRNVVRRTPGMLTTEQSALLEMLTDGQTLSFTRAGTELGVSGLVRLLERFSDGSCLLWSEALAPDLARLGGVEPGTPVRLRGEPVRILPTCAPEDGKVVVELAFSWPDGRERSRDSLIHVPALTSEQGSHRGVVLADGAFSIVAEEPPVEVIRLFTELGGLPVGREHAASVLAPLAASFPTFRKALAPYTRHHAAKAAFALDLREDDWLQIRLFARVAEGWRPGEPPGPGAVVYEYGPEGRWRRVESEKETKRSAKAEAKPSGYAEFAEPSSAEVVAEEAAGVAPDDAPDTDFVFEAPDPALVDPATQWLETTGAGPGTARGRGARGRAPSAEDANRGWWLRLRSSTARLLAEVWDERPPGCDWFGTERVRRLLVGADRLRPRIKVQSSGVDWFSISAEWESEGLSLSDADLAKLRDSSARLVKLTQGWVRREAAEVHESAAEVLADLGIEAGGGEQRVTLWQLAHAKPESLEAIERMGGSGAAGALRKLRENLADFTGLPHIDPPAGFRGTLRPYQQEGLDFLIYTSSLGLGTILADDMGLGKTIQALAWLETLRERDPQGGPTLVVCPASVMHNWVREAERFVPGMRVLLLERGERRHSLRAEIPAHDLIVTNYSLLRRDLEEWKALELRAVVLDEAQNIKNPDADISRSVLELRSRHRLALTGTPLENRALDLWSILSFVNPGYLGSRASFATRYDRVDAPPFVRRLLAAKLRPVMLRRLKLEVAKDLPPRIEERRDCEMTVGQRQLYAAELTRIRDEVAAMSESDRDVKKNRFAILAGLTRLRQLCCHPALVGGKYALGSGKFEAGFELLEPLLAEGHKVLLFSQFVECLDLLGAEMERRGIAHHVLTGKTIKREQVVTDFTEDTRPCVFLVSLKAGGTGLNLTAASYVILFDPWWNPAVEAQAIDRTHRIGQKRTVIAYRMLTEGTVEQKIWELQQRKAALAKDILGEESFARALTRDDLSYLLSEG